MGRIRSKKRDAKSISLVLQVKDPLALFLVAFLMFGDREPGASGKFTHWPFA